MRAAGPLAEPALAEAEQSGQNGLATAAGGLCHAVTIRPVRWESADRTLKITSVGAHGAPAQMTD
ncbi:hypothetical protein GCM10009738_21140 [Kitasatospora viridis]